MKKIIGATFVATFLVASSHSYANVPSTPLKYSSDIPIEPIQYLSDSSAPEFGFQWDLDSTESPDIEVA